MNQALAIRISAIVVFLGISLGAFGAHGLKEQLHETGRLANWETAVLYQLIHGLALFMLAAIPPIRAKAVFFLWIAGICLFSGSLYILALTGITKLGAITPIGGLAFLIGWLLLVINPQLLVRQPK